MYIYIYQSGLVVTNPQEVSRYPQMGVFPQPGVPHGPLAKPSNFKHSPQTLTNQKKYAQGPLKATKKTYK